MPTGGPDLPAAEGGKRRIVIPLVMLLLFLGPLALAAFLYFGQADLRPQDTLNHGTLIRPPVALPALDRPQGTLLRDDWTLVHIGSGPCGEACRESLHETRQVWRALGRKQERVQRLYLQAGAGHLPADLRAAHPDLRIVPVDRAADLLDHFSAAKGGTSASHRVYIVDPLGNLMMYYPQDADPNGLLEDLERLLRLSRIG